LPFPQPKSFRLLQSDRVANVDYVMAYSSQPKANDLVTRAAEYVRPHLDRSNPLGERLRALWAAVVAARDLGASDVVEEHFLRLAHDSGLFADLGRNADADLRHVIRWAMLNQNPFQ
jgi:hypothetical protein